MLYILIFIMCSAIMMLSESVKINRKGYGAFLVFMILFSLSSLRMDIGTDFVNYIEVYDRLADPSYVYDYKIEPLFYILLKTIQLTFDDTQLMFVFMAAITIAPAFLLRHLKSYSVGILAFILVMYLPGYSLVRQAAAISWILYATAMLCQGSVKKSFWVMIFAMGFHYSAILFLPFIIMRKVRINWVFGLIAMVFIWVNINVIDIPNLILSNSLVQSTKYGVYLLNQYNAKTELGSGLGVLLKVLPAIIFIVVSGIFKMTESKLSGARVLCLMNYAFIISAILAMQIRIFNRLSDAFLFVPVISLMYLHSNINSKFNRNAIVLFVFFLLFVNYVLTIYTNPSSNEGGMGIYPYQWIL